MRRLLPAAVGVVVVLAGAWALMSVFAGRDSAELGDGAVAAGPGVHEPAGAGAGTADAPPTSGVHTERATTAEAPLSRDELLTALARGNVVVLYPGRRAPGPLERMRDDVSGPFDPALAAAGQMVILARRPGLAEIQALAWERRLTATGATDPRLREFAEAWLGKGRSHTE